MKKGISLIVLVVTIIVIIILSASVILSIGNTNIINNANEAVFKQNIKTYMTDFEIYAANYIIGNEDISTLNVSGDNIDKTIKSIPNDLEYKEKFQIKNGNFVYVVNVKDKADVIRATWACEAGMKVEGYSNCRDIEYIEIHQTGYEKTGRIYYNTPDITGLNLSKTYFVTYDESGNEIVGTNLLRKAPDNWHDYENKEWANIVTVNGRLKTYLVWIPRYAYKVDKNNKMVDVRFVTIDNIYMAPDGTKTTYNDSEPIFDAEGNQTNYVVSSAFTVDMSDEEKENIELAGIWMSKYEISHVASGDGITGFDADVLGNQIIIFKTSLTEDANMNKEKIYEFYLDDKLIDSNNTGKYTFEGLTNGTVYRVTVKIKDSNEYNAYYGEYTRTFTTPDTPAYNLANEPVMEGLNLSKTYYLTYDESNNEIRTPVMVDGAVQAAPDNWYNYENKEWANIVVVNEEANSETYLVWIPRYEYRVVGAESTNQPDKYVDISFIPASQVVATEGYIIPEAFTVDMTDEDGGLIQLPGFWMSKYEISDSVVGG